MIDPRLASLILLTTLTGCSVGPDYQPPAPQTPTNWNDPGDNGVASKVNTTAINPRWWKSFGSPQLDSLIERATCRCNKPCCV